MEEIDLDSQSQTNSTSIDQPLQDEKIVPSSVSSSISLLELEQN